MAAIVLADHALRGVRHAIVLGRAAAAYLAVGPEGGFSAAEGEQMQNGGVAAVRLGPRVLRTETAAMAALASLQVLWGDYR